MRRSGTLRLLALCVGLYVVATASFCDAQNPERFPFGRYEFTIDVRLTGGISFDTNNYLLVATEYGVVSFSPTSAGPGRDVAYRTSAANDAKIVAAGKIGFLATAKDGALVLTSVKTRKIGPTFGARSTVTGVCLAVHGDRVFVTNQKQHRVDIYQLPTEGTKPKRVGSFGTRGSEPGEFIRPHGIATTAEGEVVVVDSGNHRVQMFDRDGTLHRYWGDFGPHPGFLANPHGVAVFEDRIYVADRDNHRIQVFDLKGHWIREWGRHSLEPREGRGALHYPETIAVSNDGKWAVVGEPFEERLQWFRRHKTAEDPEARITRIPADSHMGPSCSVHGDLLVVTEPEAMTVQLYDLSIETPVLISQFGRYGDGHGLFRSVADARFDPSGRFIDVVDPVANRLQRILVGERDEPLQFDPFLCRFAVGVSLTRTGAGLETWPSATTIDSAGNHYVLDLVGQRGPRVLKYSPSWELLLTFGDDKRTRLNYPTAITYDRWRDQVIVTDRKYLLAFATTGERARRIIPIPKSTRGFGPSRFHSTAVTENEFFVTEQTPGGDRIFVLGVDGQILRQWGQKGLGRSEFYRPSGICVTDDDRVIVVDHGNHRGQIFTKTGRFLKAFGARTYVRPTKRP